MRYVVQCTRTRHFLQKFSAWTGGYSWTFCVHPAEAWHFGDEETADAWARDYGGAASMAEPVQGDDSRNKKEEPTR